MSNLKISQLNAADPLDGTELIECVQDGANVQTTPAAIKTFIGDAAPTGEGQNDGLLTHEDKAKLDGIEAGADVTDAANVAAAGAVMTADVDDTPVDGATTAPISSNWAYDQNVLLATETDNRVLYDQQLAGGVAYATDLAGQVARTLSGSLPNNVPASASAPGVAGQMRYAIGYLYVCVATNTWQRVAIATWA